MQSCLMRKDVGMSRKVKGPVKVQYFLEQSLIPLRYRSAQTRAPLVIISSNPL